MLFLFQLKYVINLNIKQQDENRMLMSDSLQQKSIMRSMDLDFLIIFFRFLVNKQILMLCPWGKDINHWSL